MACCRSAPQPNRLVFTDRQYYSTSLRVRSANSVGISQYLKYRNIGETSIFFNSNRNFPNLNRKKWNNRQYIVLELFYRTTFFRNGSLSRKMKLFAVYLTHPVLYVVCVVCVLSGVWCGEWCVCGVLCVVNGVCCVVSCGVLCVLVCAGILEILQYEKSAAKRQTKKRCYNIITFVL